MTPGERFDQDEVLRFGDPWHGLWRNGVIELPNATTRERPGSPHNGSSRIVMIPGQPAVTTPEADAAQGMTWLNYGVISEDDILYGRSLEASILRLGWVFIDADNLPWRAVITGSTGLLTVTIHRLGLFDSPEETYSSSVSFAHPWGNNGMLLTIDDADSTGRNVALAYYPFSPVRTIQGVFLLTLSGSGATFAVDISDETPDPLLDVTSGAFEDHDPRTIWVRTDGQEISGPYVPDINGNPLGFEFEQGHSYDISYTSEPRPHYWNQSVEVIGATMIDDSFALVLGTFYVEHAGEGTFDPGDLFDPGYFREGRFRPPWYHQSTNSVTYTITLNGNETEVSGVWGTLEEWFLPPFTQESVDPDYVWVSNYYVYHVAGPAVVSGHVEVARIDNIWTYYNHSAPYLNVSVYITGQFVFRRLANRIYALSLIDAAPQYPVLRNLAVAGPNGSAISDGWEGDSAIHYATAHPVAGDMVTGPTPVCWV